MAVSAAEEGKQSKQAEQEGDHRAGIFSGSALPDQSLWRRTEFWRRTGIQTEYAYDAGSQLTALTYKQGMTTLGALSYGYDSGGRRANAGASWARTRLPAAWPRRRRVSETSNRDQHRAVLN